MANNFRVQSFSSCYTKMHSSFKFYFSNHCSNEKVPKTKVVDLEILNNFGIRNFFHLRPGRRKTEFTNCILELRVNYETAITSISSSARAAAASRRSCPRVAVPLLSSPLKLSSKPTSTSLLHSSRRAQARAPLLPLPRQATAAALHGRRPPAPAEPHPRPPSF